MSSYISFQHFDLLPCSAVNESFEVVLVEAVELNLSPHVQLVPSLGVCRVAPGPGELGTGLASHSAALRIQLPPVG